MLIPFISRRPSLRTLLAVAELVVALGPSSAVPADWMSGYTPAQFRPLPLAGKRIDPADFSEPLLAAAIFQETNRRRTDLGFPAFLPDEKASAAARLHARWMAGTHLLVHDEPPVPGATMVSPFERLAQQGLRAHVVAENIAFNLLPEITPGRPFYTRPENGRPVFSYQPDGPPLRAHTYEDFARVILAQWMHSPGHRANILNPGLRYLGVGVALAHRGERPDTIYGVQDFFTPHGDTPTAMLEPSKATRLPPRSSRWDGGG